VRINPYAKISQIRCPQDISSCNGPGYRTKRYFFSDTYCSDFNDRLSALVEDGAAVRELGYSGAYVARYLGVTNSCVTRFVASGKKPDVDDLIRNL
jgi:hypothetical protein